MEKHEKRGIRKAMKCLIYYCNRCKKFVPYEEVEALIFLYEEFEYIHTNCGGIVLIGW